MNENIAALLQGAGVKVTAERDATPAACTGHLKEVDEARGRGSDPPPHRTQTPWALGAGSTYDWQAKDMPKMGMHRKTPSQRT